MQEVNEQQEEFIPVPATRFIFHTCPVCTSLTRMPEESSAPKYFDQINDYLQFLLSKEEK
jgi:hypothetical protein